jgi:xylulokinase
MEAAILSLDIGTTMTKAVLFDPSGRELTVVEQTYKLLTPQPGWVELDPEEIWRAVLQVLGIICKQPSLDLVILGVTLSSQGGSLIPLGANGSPTYNAITWLDRRSEKVVSSWQTQGIDQHIRQISGWEPLPGLPLPSICALKQGQPEVFSTTRRFLSVNDFVVYKLTGRFCTNPSMAGEMLLTDILTGEWSSELCDLAGIVIDQLSPILPSDAICGEISPEICRLIGLDLGTPLINGGQDHSCEALALGMINPGSFLLACGTAWVINGIKGSPNLEAVPEEMALNPHVIPDRWIASQFLGGLGAGMEWWLDQFWQSPHPDKPISRNERYKSLNIALAQTEPGSSGILFSPVSGTPHSSITTGGYSGLRLAHSRADMGRAVLESAAYELRWAVETMRNSGMLVEKLWLVGGATRNSIWPQILADVTGIPIMLTQYSHGPALGAAIVAAKKLGFVNDYPRWVRPHSIDPSLENFAIYDSCYTAYRGMMEKALK